MNNSKELLFALLLFMGSCKPSVQSFEKDSPKENSNNLRLDPDSKIDLSKLPTLTLLNKDDLSSKYNMKTMGYSLVPLTTAYRHKWTDSIRMNDLYGAYFYSKFNKTITGIQPISVFVHADDYSAILLLTLTKEEKVIDFMEASGGFCSGESERLDGFIDQCFDKWSKFTTDSSFTTFQIYSMYKDNIQVKDSLTMDYVIKSTGKITQIKKDSVRIILPRKE